MKKDIHIENLNEKTYKIELEKSKKKNKAFVDDILDCEKGYIVVSEKGLSVTGSKDILLTNLGILISKLIDMGISVEEISMSVTTGIIESITGE